MFQVPTKFINKTNSRDDADEVNSEKPIVESAPKRGRGGARSNRRRTPGDDEEHDLQEDMKNVRLDEEERGAALTKVNSKKFALFFLFNMERIFL